MKVHEKVGKSRSTVFFQGFVAPEGRKVGSLKRRVQSHLARWEMKRPECVEEQGLLLLVWRHHIKKQYIKDVL